MQSYMFKKIETKLTNFVKKGTATMNRPNSLRPLRNQEGFTLVEIIAVLIILGILAAVAVPRYIDLETSSRRRGLEAAVAELNGRESLVWADAKISETSTDAWDIMRATAYTDPDSHLYLGADYTWTGDPTTGSAVLDFKGQSITASRVDHSFTKPGIWVIK